MNANSYSIRRLQWQPVRHTCGHFEIRLMAPLEDLARAGNQCSQCAPPDGRYVVDHWDSVSAALDAADRKNAQQAR